MKVRITRLYFDGLRRHREGSVINIPDTKYTKQSEIPKTSKKKLGDYVFFASSCMEIVDSKTPVVDVPRPTPGLTVTKSSSTSRSDDTVETPAAEGDRSPADANVI